MLPIHYLTVSESAGRTESQPSAARRPGSPSMTRLDPPSTQSLATRCLVSSNITSTVVIVSSSFRRRAMFGGSRRLTLRVIHLNEVVLHDMEDASVSDNGVGQSLNHLEEAGVSFKMFEEEEMEHTPVCPKYPMPPPMGICADLPSFMLRYAACHC